MSVLSPTVRLAGTAFGKSLGIRNVKWASVPDSAIISRIKLIESDRSLRSKSKKRRRPSETEVPMDDFIEVGVFTAAKSGGPGEPLYLQMHRVRSGEHRTTVTVASKPARAALTSLRLWSWSLCGRGTCLP